MSKRSYSMMMTPAQAGYRQSWEAAKRRRMTSRTGRAGLTGAQLAAVDREIVRVTTRRADKNVAQYSLLDSAADNTGECQSLIQNLTQGDSSINNYQGEGIIPLGLTVRWKWDNATADSFNNVRHLVVQYFGPANLASAGGANFVLGNTAGTNASLSYKDWNNRKQFKILYDSGPIMLQNNHIVSGSGGTNGGNGFAVTGQAYIPGKKFRKIGFTSAGNIIIGDVAVIYITDSSTIGHPEFSITSQLVFTDNS